MNFFAKNKFPFLSWYCLSLPFQSGIFSSNCSYGGGNACETNSCSNTGVPCSCESTVYFTVPTSSMCTSGNGYTVGEAVSASLNYTLCIGNYPGGSPVISNGIGGGALTEFGPAIYNTVFGQDIIFDDNNGGDSSAILWLSNPNNNFNGATLDLQAGNVRIGSATGASTINGVYNIFLNGQNGNSSALTTNSYGAEVNAVLSVLYSGNSYLGGGAVNTPLIFNDGINLNGNIFSALYIAGGWVRFASNCTGNSGIYFGGYGSGLQVTGQNALSPSSGLFLFGEGGTLQFYGTGASMTFSNGLYMYNPQTGNTPYSAVMDSHSNQVTWTGTLTSLDRYQILYINDSLGTGSISFSPAEGVTWDPTIQFYVQRGGLSINQSNIVNPIAMEQTSSSVPYFVMPSGGTCAAVYALSGVSDIVFFGTKQWLGSGGSNGLLGPGTVHLYSSVNGVGPLYLNGGTNFTGSLIVGQGENFPFSQVVIDLYGFGGPSHCSLVLNPSAAVTFVSGGNVFASISSSQPGGGSYFAPNLIFDNTLQTCYLTSGINSGSLLITLTENTQGLNTEGYPVKTAMNIESGTILYATASTVTFVNAGPDGSNIEGGIEGGVIEISSSNGVSAGSAAWITFSSLSLNVDEYNGAEQGILRLYQNGNLSSTGTMIGNGGALSNGGFTNVTLSNPWQFTGGETTSFLTSNSGPITLTGSVTVTGSGTAVLQHNGSGTLTLDFASLTVNTGASLATNGNSLTVSVLENSGAGGLILGASRNITDTLTVSWGSFSGSISDSNPSEGAIGAVTIATGGSAGLGGVNTFSGGIVLRSGATLSAGGANSLGSGTITSYGGNLVTLSSSQTFMNAFVLEGTSGTATTTCTGGWTIASSLLSITGGSGTVVLTAPGGTIAPALLSIDQGTTFTTHGQEITIGGFSSNATSGGTLLLGGATGVNGVLTISSQGASTFAGKIGDGSAGGSGVVIIEAPVTFSGNNTFSGGLTLNPSISSGTSVLTINSGSSFGKGTAIGNGGALATGSKDTITLSNAWIFNDSTTTTYNVGTAGILNLTGALSVSASGTAYIVKTGSGTLEIKGSSLSSGTYEITCSSGILIYEGDGSTMASVFLHDGIFRGEETFFALAPATVSDWSLQRTFPDPTSTNVTVAKGAIFAGLGSITSADVRGAFAAGRADSFGVLQVANDLTFEPGSYLFVPIDPVSSSLVDGTGPVTIGEGSIVRLLPRQGTYIPNEHVILTYDTLSGTFLRAEAPSFVLLDPILNYSVPGRISLIVTPLSFTSFVSNNQNAFEVAEALDTVVDWNRTNVSVEIPSGTPDPAPLLPDLLESLTPFLTGPGMTEAINELQSSFFAGVTVTSENTAVLVRSTVSGRTDYLLDTQGCFSFGSCCERKTPVWEGWISGVGEVISQDSDRFAGSPQPGYLSKTGGFVAGLDGRFFEGCYLGAFGGYTDSFTRWYEGRGQANRKAGHVGLYVSASGKQFFGNVSILGSFGNVSTKRYIEYPGVDLVANGRFADKQILTHADTGVNLVFGGFTIRPFDSLDYIAGAETGYTETEAGEWDLTVARKNAILLRNELGLKLAASFCHHRMRWTIEPKAGWVREVRIKGGDFVTSFAEAEKADAPFVVTGYFPDRSLFSPGVSITGSTLCDRLQVRVFYNGVFGGGYEDHAYGGDIRFGF